MNEIGRDITLEGEEIPVAKDPRPLWELDDLPPLAFGLSLVPTELTIDQETGKIESEVEQRARNQRLEDNWMELQEICMMVAAREKRGKEPVSCENCGSYYFNPHVATRTLSCQGCKVVFSFERYREAVNR